VGDKRTGIGGQADRQCGRVLPRGLLGFGVFGFDLPYWFTALFVVGGLAQLLYAVKKLAAVPHAAG